MANSYFTISTTTAISDIEAALQNKYGAENVTVYSESTSYLIFSCAALSDKVIKITKDYSLLFSYGDTWSSGSTITNSVPFSIYNDGTLSALHLVLGNNLFYLCQVSTGTKGGCIIGRLSNEKYVCVGFSSSSNAGLVKGRDTTDNLDLIIGTLAEGFSSSSGKLYKQLPIFIKTSGAIEENSDGSIAYIDGLYNISYSTSNSTLVKGGNYLMSYCFMTMSDGNQHLKTSLFAEW